MPVVDGAESGGGSSGMNRAARGGAQAHPPAEIACAGGFPLENTNDPGSFALQKKIAAVCGSAPFALALLDAHTRSAPVRGAPREGRKKGHSDRSAFFTQRFNNKMAPSVVFEEDQVEGCSLSYFLRGPSKSTFCQVEMAKL